MQPVPVHWQDLPAVEAGSHPTSPKVYSQRKLLRTSPASDQLSWSPPYWKALHQHAVALWTAISIYINSEAQKAFTEGAPWCTEHEYLRIASHPWCEKKSVQDNCLLARLGQCFWFYPSKSNFLRSMHGYPLSWHFIQTIQSLYSGLIAVISSKDWEIQPVHLAIGLFQEDPLYMSSAIFNIINLHIDTLALECNHIGYCFVSSHHQMTILWYETSLADHWECSWWYNGYCQGPEAKEQIPQHSHMWVKQFCSMWTRN